MAFLFGIVMVLGLFLFSRTFISVGTKGRLWRIGAVVLGGGLALVSLTDVIVKNIRVVDGSYLSGDLSSWYILYLGYFLGCLGAAVVSFIRKYTKVTGSQKTQLAYVTAGVLGFFIPFLVTQMLLPLVGIFRFNNLGPVFAIVMVTAIGYAIVRHQLLDIRVVVQRGLIYTILLMFTLGLYLSLVSWLGYLFEQATRIAYVSGALTAVIGIFSAPTLETYFQKVTDRIFFKQKYVYAEALHQLSEVLNRNLDLDTLIARSALKLKQIFKARDVTLRLYARKRAQAGEPAAEPGQASMAIPITTEGAAIGYMEMKEKLCGDPYTAEDLKLLKTFAHQAAVALEKAKLYQRVKDHSKELEEKVRERTKEIQELQEEQRQVMLDISHGLQSPLTVVKGEIDVLKRATPQSKHLAAVGKSIDEISKFIYNLLHLARMDMVQGSFKEEPVNLSDLLDELVEYYEVLAREKGVAIRKAIDPGIVIRGDRDKLKELVTNLVSNAFKYMAPDREKKVFIGLRKTDGLAELTVEDTGIGISPEDLPKIFNRFYRARKDGESQIEGAGLGLAICQKIVEKHNGAIEVKSAVGKGTTFRVRIKAENPAKSHSTLP